MESQDVDRGISDIMARSLTIKSPDQNNDDKPETSTQNGICENREQLQQYGYNENSQNNEPNHENGATEINLSDPGQVIELLNTVDLSEEDTEALLQEAYTMNKKLKEMLRRQEQASPSANRSVRQRTVERAPHSKGSAASSQGGSRNGSASIASRTPLPPIKKEQTSIYAVKLRRSRTTVQDHSPTRDYTIQRSKTKPKTHRKLPSLVSYTGYWGKQKAFAKIEDHRAKAGMERQVQLYLKHWPYKNSKRRVRGPLTKTDLTRSSHF